MTKIAIVVLLFLFVTTASASDNDGNQLLEQGRTFVHHAVKRMAFILPAIFFKLGIAFTLLVLVTIVAVNNGFIGFMLLVVGLSSVLARLQEARHHQHVEHVPVAAWASSSPSHHYAHFVDRSDAATEKQATNAYVGYPYGIYS